MKITNLLSVATPRQHLWLALLPLASAVALPNHAARATPNFEGVWMAAEGAPPDANARAPGAGPSSGPADRAPAGPPNAGPDNLTVELSGTTLQCAPVEHLSVGGGGMSMLLVQSTRQIVLVSEFDMDVSRKIYLDAAHPSQVIPQPNGHSIGHWDNNTLVVDTVGYADTNGKDAGKHVVERFTRNGNTLTDQASISEQNGNTTQRTLSYQIKPGVQFNENVCEEGAYRYQVVNGVLDNPNIPPDK